MTANSTNQPVPARELAKLSGLSERQLRRHADDGWLPRPLKNEYLLVPAIRGLLRYCQERERAAQVLLQNEKLRVVIRRLKRELVSAREVSHLGAELGAAIRKLVTRIHRMAPSLAGDDVAIIEKRLQEEKSDIAAQRRIVDERVSTWRQEE